MNGAETALIEEVNAPILPTEARPRWRWPLMLSLTALGAMVAGWYASALASQWHLWP